LEGNGEGTFTVFLACVGYFVDGALVFGAADYYTAEQAPHEPQPPQLLFSTWTTALLSSPHPPHPEPPSR
jgi:hypothetical protein